MEEREWKKKVYTVCRIGVYDFEYFIYCCIGIRIAKKNRFRKKKKIKYSGI